MTDSKIPEWVSDHVKLYQTDPEKAHLYTFETPTRSVALPTLLLTTTGRKSGKPIPATVLYSKQESGFAVVASKRDSTDDPAWYLNLEANPEAEIQVGADHYKIRARKTAGAEREKIWAEMNKLYPHYEEHQAKVGREIPVVLLEPR